MSVKELLNQFHDIASDPKKQMDRYLAEGRKVVLTAPVYTPEELVHAIKRGQTVFPGIYLLDRAEHRGDGHEGRL